MTSWWASRSCAGSSRVGADRALEVLAGVGAADVEQEARAGTSAASRAQDASASSRDPTSDEKRSETPESITVIRSSGMPRCSIASSAVCWEIVSTWWAARIRPEARDPGGRHVAPLGDVVVAHDQRNQVVERDHKPAARACPGGQMSSSRARPRRATSRGRSAAPPLPGRIPAPARRPSPIRAAAPRSAGTGRPGSRPTAPIVSGARSSSATRVLGDVAGDAAPGVPDALGSPRVEPDGARRDAHLSRRAAGT